GGDVFWADREEPGLDGQTQRELRDGGGRGPLGSRLPRRHGGGAFADQGRQLALAQSRQVAGQREASSVEQSGNVGCPVRSSGTSAHHSPLARSRRCSSACRRRRTGASGTVFGPVGSGVSSVRRSPCPGGVPRRSCLQCQALLPPELRRARPNTSSICWLSGSRLCATTKVTMSSCRSAVSAASSPPISSSANASNKIGRASCTE